MDPKKAVFWTLFILVDVVVLFFVVGFFLPGEYSVSRDIEIDAPVDVVFLQVSDLSKNEAWSPWHAQDSTMETTLCESTTGEGACYSWTSENSGDGKLTTLVSKKNKHIENQIVFGEMGEGVGTWDFAETESGGTQVTWGMTGQATGSVDRWFGLFIDGMVGPSFELGLSNLKGVAEAYEPPPPPPPPPEPEPEPEPEEAREGDDGSGEEAAEGDDGSGEEAAEGDDGSGSAE